MFSATEALVLEDGHLLTALLVASEKPLPWRGSWEVRLCVYMDQVSDEEKIGTMTTARSEMIIPVCATTQLTPNLVYLSHTGMPQTSHPIQIRFPW